ASREDAMILSDLLGSDALDPDGRRLGAVFAARLEAAGAPAQLLAATVVRGLLVSPHSRFSTWGYERRGDDGPFLIAHLQRWLDRGTVLVAWGDGELVDRGRVVFRRGFERHDPT